MPWSGLSRRRDELGLGQRGQRRVDQERVAVLGEDGVGRRTRLPAVGVNRVRRQRVLGREAERLQEGSEKVPRRFREGSEEAAGRGRERRGVRLAREAARASSLSVNSTGSSFVFIATTATVPSGLWKPTASKCGSFGI